ncbi:MAG: hypothetical protein ABR915_19170 [Thermoguttaceae bacterium]
MLEEIKSLMKSELPRERMLGWEQLRADYVENRCSLGRQDFGFLMEMLRDEPDARIWRCEMNIFSELLALSLTSPPGGGSSPQSPSPGSPPDYLYQWLSDPFHWASAIFGTANEWQLRDAMAWLVLARRLPELEFPNTRMIFVPPGTVQWEESIHRHHLQAICLVGRLGLYGQGAIIDRWSCKNARFGFLLHERPADCPPHGLHPDYNCIWERLGDNQRAYYRASGEDVRTDFALVLRYPVTYLGVQVIVVHCAGTSWLGTLGAAQWAASDLTRPTHLNGTPIPCPPNIDAESRLEALLEVTGNVSAPFFWATPRVALRKLFVDGASWSVEDRRWDAQRTLTLVCQKGDPHRPVGVRIDGKEHRMAMGRGACRLLAGLIQVAQKEPEGYVDLAQLAQDPWVWPEGGVTEDHLRHRLASLKHCHHLDGILSIDRRVQLHGTVTIESEDAGGGEAIQPECEGPPDAPKPPRRRKPR